MKYITDTTIAVEEFLRDKYKEAHFDALDAEIDSRKALYCQKVRTFAGVEKDPSLTEFKREADLRRRTSTKVAASVLKKMDFPFDEDSLNNERRTVLNERIEEIEKNHAVQTELFELADEHEVHDQADVSAVMLIALEAAHEAMLKELKSLTPKTKES